MSREALVLLVCCCDFRDGAERLIPSKSLGNAVIRAFPGLFRILRMCAPRHAAAVVRPRERKKSADRRRRILISRLLIIRASVPRRKSPFPAYFKGFPAVSLLIPPYPAFLKYPVSPHTNINIANRIVSFDIKELGKQLKKIGMLIVQDAVWNRVTVNREAHKSTRYYIDEMHLLLREEQTAAYTVEIWKRFRKWGGIPTGITQNVKDLLSSREVENIFENSDFILMLNQASGDRQILAKQLNISPHQLSYVTHSGEGEGLLFYGNVILPFVDRFPRGELYDLLTTKPQEQTA